MPTLFHGNEIVAPSVADTEVAKASSRTLAPHVGEASLRIQVKDGTGDGELILPPSAARLLLGILTEMGQGNAVAVSPIQAELTTNQAAELLNVSRPYLTKLFDEGVLPFRKVGSHHRVRLADVLAYKKDLFTKRHAALDELTALDQELGLYDAPMK
jgi:excisionase family DNA binding protein